MFLDAQINSPSGTNNQVLKAAFFPILIETLAGCRHRIYVPKLH